MQPESTQQKNLSSQDNHMFRKPVSDPSQDKASRDRASRGGAFLLCSSATREFCKASIMMALRSSFQHNVRDDGGFEFLRWCRSSEFGVCVCEKVPGVAKSAEFCNFFIIIICNTESYPGTRKHYCSNICHPNMILKLGQTLGGDLGFDPKNSKIRIL